MKIEKDLTKMIERPFVHEVKLKWNIKQNIEAIVSIYVR